MTIAESIRTTKKLIVNALNVSGLPIDIMDLLLGEIKTAVHNQAEEEYKKEMAEKSAGSEEQQ